ncbi:hypothetical protein HPB50_016639 [Hyalomma asiaticum]|uniref:Uncharacterized protein n=1 Tax=Hyalomma asiaticum TaxID=266040 RepID=A0ACB7SI35_HYAAI|nr:hypothetical protein HPB50_016639 [Hyalomma asiaticum]
MAENLSQQKGQPGKVTSFNLEATNSTAAAPHRSRNRSRSHSKGRSRSRGRSHSGNHKHPRGRSHSVSRINNRNQHQHLKQPQVAWTKTSQHQKVESSSTGTTTTSQVSKMNSLVETNVGKGSRQNGSVTLGKGLALRADSVGRAWVQKQDTALHRDCVRLAAVKSGAAEPGPASGPSCGKPQLCIFRGLRA